MAMKYSFLNDYSEGAHPRILESLSNTNLVQESGYGEDSLSIRGADVIKKKIENEHAAIHFVSGGTQANLIVLASLLKPYESVISVSSAHICVHEAGAIESTGHKINSVVSKDGKITPAQIKEVYEEHNMEHMVKPKAVFISQATELGTVYTINEIQQISDLCKQYGLYLYLDGARIGTALAAVSDLTLSDIAKLVDVFYIGGTKNGALLGEAVVIINQNLQEGFRYHMKQRGALLAKGRIMGAQFLELFKDDLYFLLAGHANDMAKKLTAGIKELGFTFLTESPTNQIFPILPIFVIEKLQELYGFYVWQKVDDQLSAIRLVTSWATKEDATEEFLRDLQSAKEKN